MKDPGIARQLIFHPTLRVLHAHRPRPRQRNSAKFYRPMRVSLSAAVFVAQSRPLNGSTYCSAMSQGKKIQVSWLTSVMKVSTIGRPLGLA